MSKLEVEFELTGLKFKVTGERDDVSGALAQLQKQIATLAHSASSAAGALDGKTIENGTGQIVQPSLEAVPKSLPSGKASKARRGASGLRKTAEAIEFKHDAEKYGFPKQEWTTANKAMWLLYVLEIQTEHKEVSAGVLAATFKKHFKQFGGILAHNISRDLGAAKGKTGYVNSDAGKDPETWFLLAGGKKAMETLIQNPNSNEASVGE